MKICTWLVADEKKDESVFPQNKGKSSEWTFQETYWKCVVCFFCSARRFSPQAELVFFHNVTPRVEASDYLAQLDLIGVEVKIVPFKNRPPAGFAKSFGNQFYIFDIISLINDSDIDEVWCVLDSDCVITRDSLSQIMDDWDSAVVNYDVGYEIDWPVNGVSSEQLATLAREEGLLAEGGKVSYMGGEIFMATRKWVNCNYMLLGEILEKLLARFERGDPTVTEEAHVLSIWYSCSEGRKLAGDGIVKRMWTSLKHSNIVEGDERLPIWHLPSEKRQGFPRLYQQLKRCKFDERSTAAILDKLPRYFGIPKRDLRKLILDYSAALFSRLK